MNTPHCPCTSAPPNAFVPDPLLGHRFPRSLGPPGAMEKARRCVHGPTRPAELGLWTGGAWGAAPGDAGTEFSLSPGAARGNPGSKMPLLPQASPSRRRRQSRAPRPRLRQFGLLVFEGHAREGDPPPLLGAAGQATSTGSSTVLSGLVSEAQVPSGIPQFIFMPLSAAAVPQLSPPPPPRPAPAPELGGGTVWVGSWPWTGHVRRPRRWDPRMWKGYPPGEEDTRTPRACTAGLPRRGPPAGGW